jgi:hypothetical protein
MKLYYIFGIILVLASCGCLEENSESLENSSISCDKAVRSNLTVAIQKDNITDILETNDTLYIYKDINYTRSY